MLKPQEIQKRWYSRLSWYWCADNEVIIDNIGSPKLTAGIIDHQVVKDEIVMDLDDAMKETPGLVVD